MTATRPDWQRVKALFEDCLPLDPAERGRLLGEDTTVPPDVRAEVEALLAAHAGADALDAGAAAFGATLFAGVDGESPARVGAYRLLHELGRGGMGVVYLAERDEPGFAQRVALKRLRAGLDGEELRARFRRERGILARLAHDRIARLLDGGVEADGRPWFALEYVEGEAITRWCDAQRLPLRARAQVFLDVLEAVAFAHRNLIVHRDLKPANVLVDTEGRVKLLDFGIAKLLADDEAGDHTTAAVPMLTPAYAAPEQVRGEAVSTATDIYALGVLWYELAVGLSPYRVESGSRQAVLQAVQEQAPERLSRALLRTDADAVAAARGTTPTALRRELDRDLDRILERALAKAPEQRYPSVDAFAADLRAWREYRPLLSAPTPRLQRVVHFVRRHRVGVAASVLGLLTAGTGVCATLWQAHLALRHAATERAVREFTVGLFQAVDPDLARGRTVPLREVLDQGATRAEQGFKDQPAVRGALLSDLGAVYASLGDTARALALLGTARDALAALPDRDVDELARTWLRLAQAQTDDQQYAAAAQSADAALALLAGRSPSDALYVDAALRRVRADEDLDRLDAAAARLEPLLAALRADKATTPATLADALGTLANLRRLQARADEAMAAAREALDVTRATDADGPGVASRLHELASAEQAASQPMQAIAHLREAYALHKKNYGERHPLTLSTEGELAFALSHSTNFAEAESLFQHNIALRGEVFGADHAALANPLNNYAVGLYTQHRYAEAAPRFERAWHIWEKALGADHVRTRQAKANYAGALTELGREAEAEPILRQSLAEAQRLDPPGTWGPKYNTLGVALEHQGNLAEAEDVLRQGLANDITVNAGLEIKYPWTRTLLGRVLYERGDLAGAREQLEKALVGYDTDDLPDGPKTATCLFELARLRQAQHEPGDRVKPLLERALAAQEAKLGPDDAATVATRELLARWFP